MVDHRLSVTVNRASLAELAMRGVPVPTYDRTVLAPRIVHVGVGGFHRAHMALYTDELAREGSDWAIRGLGLLAHDARLAGALAAQDHLYTLTEKVSDQAKVRVVGSLVDYRLAVDDAAMVAATLGDPHVSIISLTITEAGYAEPTDGQPTTCDLIVAALDQRRLAGGGPITILSCDNLPGNGTVTRRAMLSAAARHPSAADLAAWLDGQCSFPNSMVDRITPATTDADRAWLLDHHAIVDAAPVVAEPFRQWVIEDRFVAGRPAWHDVGVLFTDDVHSWELYKLRLLNAGHSCIAYLCALAGIRYVDEAMSTPVVVEFVERLLLDEAVPTLEPIAGHPAAEYVASVLHRFANTAVRDQIGRLCIDGTAKFPTFLIPTIVRQLQLAGPIHGACLALAGWARYLAVTPVADQSFDASADIARRHAQRFLVDPLAFLDFSEVFPPELALDERFRAAFARAAAMLADHGPLAAMSAEARRIP